MPQRRIDQVFEWYQVAYKDEALLGMSDVWLRDGYIAGYESAELVGYQDPFVWMNKNNWCKNNMTPFGVRRYLRAFERGYADATSHYADGGVLTEEQLNEISRNLQLEMARQSVESVKWAFKNSEREQSVTIPINLNVDEAAFKKALESKIAEFFEEFAKGLRK